KQLPTTLERYAKVYRDAGFNLDLNRLKLGPLQIDASDEARHFFNDHPGSWVGIAPFAKHKGKRYPLEKMEDLIAKIVDQYDFVMLFGGGPKEIQKLESLEAKFKNAISLAGKFSLDDELFLMMNLKWMLCMDSANMHMAALAGVRTFSIWGATHPYAGFLSYNHKEEDVIQIAHDELDCRPCSVYGNKSCHRGDYACLNWITTEMILNKLQF
ncbi:MAG: glycosyltransferase family 9 protein, partial [Bacteroidota bacterium]